MAVNRTVLARKGLVQPKHGDNYEADIDNNWAALDANVLYAGDPVEVNLAPTAPGNFTVAHGLDHEPYGVIVCMTSGGAIWFQLDAGALKKDATNLYLVASAAGITGRAIVW